MCSFRRDLFFPRLVVTRLVAPRNSPPYRRVSVLQCPRVPIRHCSGPKQKRFPDSFRGNKNNGDPTSETSYRCHDDRSRPGVSSGRKNHYFRRGFVRPHGNTIVARRRLIVRGTGGGGGGVREKNANNVHPRRRRSGKKTAGDPFGDGTHNERNGRRTNGTRVGEGGARGCGELEPAVFRFRAERRVLNAVLRRWRYIFFFPRFSGKKCLRKRLCR